MRGSVPGYGVHSYLPPPTPALTSRAWDLCTYLQRAYAPVQLDDINGDPRAASHDDGPSAGFFSKMPLFTRRVIGVVMALLSGALYGSNFNPPCVLALCVPASVADECAHFRKRSSSHSILWLQPSDSAVCVDESTLPARMHSLIHPLLSPPPVSLAILCTSPHTTLPICLQAIREGPPYGERVHAEGHSPRARRLD